VNPGHYVGQSGPFGLKGYTEGHLMKVAWMVRHCGSGALARRRGRSLPPSARLIPTASLVAEDCCGLLGRGKQKAIAKKDRTKYERDRLARCAESCAPRSCHRMLPAQPPRQPARRANVPLKR